MSEQHLEPPDDVDVILSQERFEESDEYDAELIDWLVTSSLARDWARDTFPGTTRYDTKYTLWCEAQKP